MSDADIVKNEKEPPKFWTFSNLRNVKATGWMILASDAIHNFAGIMKLILNSLELISSFFLLY